MRGLLVRAVFTSVLDVLGAACVAVFVWFVWPPLVIAVVGAACLLASWRLSTGGRES